MKKMNNKGFSLVELIIVIAIMAILAGALAPALISYVAKSRRSTTVSNAQTIASGVTAALSDEAAFDAATTAFSATGVASATPLKIKDQPTSGNDFWEKVDENVSGGLKSYATLKATKTSKKGTANPNKPIASDDGYYMFVDTATSSVEISIKLTDGTYVQVYPNATDDMTK